MNITVNLRAMLEVTGQYSVAHPVPPIDARTVDRLCREALAEIERLEGEVARVCDGAMAAASRHSVESERLEREVIQERGRRAADRQEYDAVTRALRQQLDAYTDRMIAAGLMA